MGTRGLVVIYYQNKCYTFYNHWDSYFDFLGKILVNSLVQLLKNPEKLEELKNVFSKMNELNNKIDNFDKENIKSIDLPDLPELENFSIEENIFLKLINALNELINNNCVNITTKYYADLARSMGCEWTYILDLDYESFSIKSIGDELCINNIPLDIKKLEGLIHFYDS